MKITQADAQALTLPPDRNDAFLWDGVIPQFGVRARRAANGKTARTWLYGYRTGKVQHRITIGSIEIIKEPAARKRASEFYALVKAGRDPQTEKIEAITQSADTFERLLKPYLARKKTELRAGSYRNVERHLLINLKPLHRLPVTALGQRLVATRLEEIAVNSGPMAANLTRSSGSAFFRHLMQSGIASSNPFVATAKAKTNGARERVLGYDELKVIHGALLGDDDYSDIVRILMRTGMRREEAGGLEWSEVDTERALICLPAQRCKNGREHTLPIPPTVMEILRRRPRTWPDRTPRKFVFGRTRDSGFVAWSRGKRLLDARITPALRAWVHHDLRRSFSTHLHNDLEVAPHIVEAIINHVGGHKGGVAGTYNRAKYLRQMKVALDAWDAHLTAVLEGREPASNVISMQK